MSSTDLFVDGYPHGTPQGYDDGCRGGACPTGVAYGLSCKIAKQKSSGDYQYQRLVKSGASIPSIAYALGLVGTESAPAPAAPKKKPARVAPTPATAKGGVSLVDAAAAVAKVAAAGAGSIADIAASAHTDEPTATAGAVVTSAVEQPADYQTAPEAAQPAAPELVTPAPEPLEPDQTPTTDATPAPTPREIRAWAIAKGYDVASMGKIPQHIVDHYWEATGRLNPAAATTAPDTDTPAAVTTAPKTVTEDTKPATTDADDVEPDTEGIDEVTVEITIDVPDTIAKAARPDWSDVAAHVDVEAARSLAARLWDELTQVEAALAAAQQEIETTTADYVETFGQKLALEGRIGRRDEQYLADRRRIVALQQRAEAAEQATAFVLQKWGEERAAVEASTELIHQQARTINTLSSYLEPARIVHGFDVATADERIPPFCEECSGPYSGWLGDQYGGHWDTCPNRPKGAKPLSDPPTLEVPLIATNAALRLPGAE
jgi:hypothetical protein